MVYLIYIRKIITYFKLYTLLIKSLYYKKCYFGPFVGEFGHLLCHIIPFLSFLNSKGVEVYYCGVKIHKPFFYDSKGNLIVKKFYKLRDFYSEVLPLCNDQNYPRDVDQEVNNFVKLAQSSKFPFWDIRERFFYFDCYCRWMYYNTFVKVYKSINSIDKKKKIVSLFPSIKKTNYIRYRGEDWDYNLLIDKIYNEVDEINILGHPSFSGNIKKRNKLNILLTNDNNEIFDKCKMSNFIVTPMSGVHFLGVYCKNKVLVMLKGKNLDYSNLVKDNFYRKKLGEDYSIKIINNFDELINNIKR